MNEHHDRPRIARADLGDSDSELQDAGSPSGWLADTEIPPTQMIRHRRPWAIPLLLFLLTLASTFWVGITDWQPVFPLQVAVQKGDLLLARQMAIENWQQGLAYMGAVILILLLHELGHFVATLIYRIPASVPIFLPFPFNPIGTLGAVILMQGMLANRRQIFDIGIAGPLAGLVAAIPLCVLGIGQLDLTDAPQGGLGFRLPLLMQWMCSWLSVEGYSVGQPVWLNQLNPVFAAAWVGLLITGLNMIPVGQLDGGHVTYCLFGRHAHWIAQAAMVLAVAFMVYHQNYMLIVMVALLLIIGTKHPPTSDDSVSLGWFRWFVGLVSLTIPILCFPPLVLELAY